MKGLLKQAVLVTLVGVLAGLLVNALRRDGAALDVAAVPHREEACAGVAWTSPELADEALQDGHLPLILDARERRHYEDGHIAAALSVPYRVGDELPSWVLQRVRALGGRKVITYCDASGNCARSTKLAEALYDATHATVEVLQGGWPEWEARRLPAEVGPCRECPR